LSETDKLYLFWYNKKEGNGNFGDELGPYIIKKLTGKEVKHVLLPRSGLKRVLAYLKGLPLGYYSIKSLPLVFDKRVFIGDYIISVGSIIGWGNGKRTVWGSGVLFKNEKIDNANFLAVRGEYTKNRLAELGFSPPNVVGDPALLLPLVYESKDIQKEVRLGLIPHHTQYEHFKDYENGNKLLVINLLDGIEGIIEQINSCEYIISSSLHGLIVAHAYGIPALWYCYPHIEWQGDDIKFLDYLSSVGIEEYKPFILKEKDKFDSNIEIRNVQLNNKLSLIQNDLSLIQNNLLKVAPFDIRSKYKDN
jgi:hypothetical protein